MHAHTLIARPVLSKETQVPVSTCCESDGRGPTCCLLTTWSPHLHVFSLAASQPLSSTADAQISNDPHATTNPKPYYSSHLLSPSFSFLTFILLCLWLTVVCHLMFQAMLVLKVNCFFLSFFSSKHIFNVLAPPYFYFLCCVK